MFTGLPLLDRFYLSYIWFYAPWLYYDVSLHDLVELVASFDSSPRSSNSESGCSSYCVSSVSLLWGVFLPAGLVRPARTCPACPSGINPRPPVWCRFLCKFYRRTRPAGPDLSGQPRLVRPAGKILHAPNGHFSSPPIKRGLLPH